MRLCVFGAGAVGGLLAAKLIAANVGEVSLVGRGAHLEAIRQRGLRLVDGDREQIVFPSRAVGTADALGEQDVVFVTLKTSSQSRAARDLARLCGPESHVVFISNGIPWWWQHGLMPNASPLPLVDPEGLLWNVIGPQRAIGAVVYSINEIIEPGVIGHSGNNRWFFGEPDGSTSPRLQSDVALCCAAGLNATASADLRREIWAKLLRNASLNSICALTRVSIDVIAKDAELMRLFDTVVDEIAATALACGWDVSEAARAARDAPRLGGVLDRAPASGVKPSMLQDVLAGRPTEVEAILGQPQAFARETGTPTPAIDVILPLLRAL